MNGPVIRTARADDYDAIAIVIDDWWGRSVLPHLPRLFLDHFYRTSLVAEVPAVSLATARRSLEKISPREPTEWLAGFLIGFLSPSESDEAYIHFVGIDPQSRKSGLARELYERFFAIARANDRHIVKAITSSGNDTSIGFHRHLGFTVSGPVRDYNGPGHHLITFERKI
ncbi:GNAT family N-acetyltransferase [Nocardia sp. NBC_00565]|uniref:GNAT family N-acetyltransferase n=1 Tax=Nocardia sp. NBC_00565 TaxID=2975993 RepID=UPI003FA580B8